MESAASVESDAIGRWLRVTASYHYPRAGGDVGELAAVIAHAPDDEQLVLHQALGELRRLASRCLARRSKFPDQRPTGDAALSFPTAEDRALAAVCLDAAPLLEAALLVMCAALLDAAAPPRTKHFYPAVLINDCALLLRSSEADAGSSRLIELVRTLCPAELAEAVQVTGRIAVGFGVRLPWPAAADARRVADAMRRLEPCWHRAAASVWDAWRPHPRHDEKRRFLRAWWCCTRARQYYELLAQDSGWLRLLLCYKLELLGALRSRIARSALDEVVEVLVHEIAWVLAGCTESALFPGQSTELLAGPVSASPRERKNLQRARYRLLWSGDARARAALAGIEPFCHEQDDEFLGLLYAIRRVVFGSPHQRGTR